MAFADKRQEDILNLSGLTLRGGKALKKDNTMRRSFCTAGFLLVAATTLSGCGGKPDPVLAQAFGYSCGAAENAPDTLCTQRPPGNGGAEVSRFCYKSLADASCFDRPDPDRKNQQQGSSGY